MADPAEANGVGGADVAPFSVNQDAKLIESLYVDQFPADQREAFKQARIDLQAAVDAEGGIYEDHAEELAARKAAELGTLGQATSDERNDACTLYVEGLVRTVSLPVEAVQEASRRDESSFLACPFVPGNYTNDLFPDVVHLALPVVSLVTSVPSNAKRLQQRPPMAGLRIRTALSVPSLRGGTYTVVGGTATAAGPVLLVRYGSTCGSRAVLLVVPRSSSNPSAWMRNFTTRLQPPPPAWGLPDGALVHAGFLAVASGLLETTLFHQIEGEVADYAAHHPGGPPMEVVWAGHSLGGALASLLAAVASRRAADAGKGAIKSTLVTFGGPRVGNAATQTGIAERTVHTRVTTALDPVPGLPRVSRELKYSAAPAGDHRALYQPGGGAAVVQVCSEDTTDADTNWLTFAELDRFLRTAHPLDHYLQRMHWYYRQLMASASNGAA
eukprot:TRINITY_DN3237_c0_g1_i4.p2 TRINITY_DN3237_c0_g1~~TRINITY_DN3237_c0_g1_i4.p2  ORF type:complete len:442 (-),score=80.73 TRINITY_DN3237_c0_g1_i4:947-2272(-)